MYKIWFDVYDRNHWYDIIRECKKWFGKEWRGQRGVRRKLDMFHTFHLPVRVWFLVPDPAFKTWIDLKYTQSDIKQNK